MSCLVAFHYRSYWTFFYNKIGSIISIGDLPTTNIIEPLFIGVEELRFLFCLQVFLIKITYILVKFKQI